jgi:hypothetical protein
VDGCIKGLLRLGCFALIAAVLLALWWFREPILRTGARWFGRTAALPPVADTAVGAPTPKAVASGQTKVGTLRANAGPDSVVLNANEVASLIGSSIDWRVRKTYDSLRVELLEGSLAVHARLDTRALPPDALGPFAAFVQPREPLRLGGTIEISIRGIAFPGPTVKSIARQTAGANADGAIPLQVDPAISRIVIHPTGVILYRTRSGAPR